MHMPVSEGFALLALIVFVVVGFMWDRREKRRRRDLAETKKSANATLDRALANTNSSLR